MVQRFSPGWECGVTLKVNDDPGSNRIDIPIISLQNALDIYSPVKERYPTHAKWGLEENFAPTTPIIHLMRKGPNEMCGNSLNNHPYVVQPSHGSCLSWQHGGFFKQKGRWFFGISGMEYA